MSPQKVERVMLLLAEGQTPYRIAKEVDVHPYSVRWLRDRERNLKKQRDARRARGCFQYACGKCGGEGHNRRTCTA